jgi:ankyrin repeat protein
VQQTSPKPKSTRLSIASLKNEQRLKAWLKLQWVEGGDGISITPLHIAARYGLISYAGHLVSEKIDVHAVDTYGRTPLWWAAHSGHSDIVRLLVQAGADPDVDDKVAGLKPLHEAADNNHAGVVRVLLEAGVNPLTEKTREYPGMRCGNAPTSTGHTALMVKSIYSITRPVLS